MLAQMKGKLPKAQGAPGLRYPPRAPWSQHGCGKALTLTPGSLATGRP